MLNLAILNAAILRSPFHARVTARVTAEIAYKSSFRSAKILCVQSSRAMQLDILLAMLKDLFGVWLGMSLQMQVRM